LAPVASSFEIVLVNDGSRDRSWEAIRRLAAEHPSVHGLNMMRNYGQHNALLAGIRAARGELIVTLDDDLQNPPEEIPKMLGKLAEGFDVVYGKPMQEQHGFWRDLASIMTKLVLRNFMSFEAARNASPFRLFRARVREAFQDFQGSHVAIDVLLGWGTTQFGAVTVRHDPRLAGASNYTLRKLIRHAIDLMTGFSVLPLRLASYMGFAFTIFGMLVLVYVVGRYFISGASVQGFAFLASIIAIFSGAQLFSLGIIGEYLGRIHQRSLGRPSYVLREETPRDQNHPD
jgi:undecaprenyl-phosphate 4-deoxy-4-formamido-L-arabinose transferase